jgi:hypothetical protein
MDTPEYLEAQQTMRALAASDHLFAGQVRKLALALSRLPVGEHELRVVDDYVHDGVVSEWILPVVVRVVVDKGEILPFFPSKRVCTMLADDQVGHMDSAPGLHCPVCRSQRLVDAVVVILIGPDHPPSSKTRMKVAS